eukprot:CAMPEP_0183311564 /NCGR_PEP_ID=MMETSP0160_2-20130417/37668_1 /TAXON_ID=2839 ORGANISM="Odontella Sinensis, Strain Grunow 1884" /NCGR_SAMPLE_ID=MMETSP0160_2 /ASSEMBLY_ACC=CAM_ASM_000250 /LENGTH=216 /DNA_ID=CAMNT_0025476187 /DNA_START=99 /DNA_END=749 /DNA_ORIENTATION=+
MTGTDRMKPNSSMMATFSAADGASPGTTCNRSKPSTLGIPRSKHRSCVHFATAEIVDYTIGRWEYTDHEKKAYWYNSGDMNCFMKSASSKECAICATVKAFFTNKSKCPRGLEMVDVESTIRRELARRDVVEAVLSEQEKQRRQKIHDDWSISVVSSRAARLSKEHAKSVGASDAKAAAFRDGDLRLTDQKKEHTKHKRKNKILRLFQTKNTPCAA